MIRTAMEYHEKTSYRRDTIGGYGLDWDNQPFPFKIYSGELIPLPGQAALAEENLSTLLNSNDVGTSSAASLSLETLAQVLRLTYSVTAKSHYPGGAVYYRCTASAGALYPTEIYLAARDLVGLESGVYHYSPAHHGLTVLRRGNFQETVGRIVVPPLQGLPDILFFLSAICFRSAWKYRDRAYRYHLLDTGHVLEHLVLALTCFGLPARFTFDFLDEPVHRVLGLDMTREVCLAISRNGKQGPQGDDAIEDIEELPDSFRTPSITARQERKYQTVTEIHAAGVSIVKPDNPPTPMTYQLGLHPESWTRLDQVERWPELLGYAESVMSRRSRRNFVPHHLSRAQARALIDSLCKPDFEAAAGLSCYAGSVGVGFLARDVDGVASGFYLIDHMNKLMALVKTGDFIPAMTRICLDQMWLGSAAFHFLFIADLEILDRQYGPRGYRYAMLTAGRLGARLYLVATALGLGCCGIGALYDYEAQELLELNQTSRLLYLVAVGKVKGDRE